MKLHQWPIIPLLLALTACANLTTDERAALSPSARAFEVQSELVTLVQQVNIYAAQEFCTAEVIVACADRQIVIEAGRIADEADRTVRAAQAAVRAGADNTGVLAAGASVPILTKVSQRACVLRFWGNDEDIGMHLAVSRGAGDAGRVGFWAEHAAEAGLAGTDRVAVG